MKPILEIQGIGKKYRIQGNTKPYLSLRESLSGFLKPSSRLEDFWALDDITFNVMPGETVGIIGKNGAGKSTLLKILSRITPPTRGRIISRGRIASLLEVGTGFHPELTGRENIFLNGSILGMKRFEIQKQFDAIIEFSGVEKFIDTPLKHYSSGMQLRLAFSVAAFLEPEILIVDEVLAVGDSEFQKKCLGKMEDVSKKGRTILFVSHDLTAISNLTKKTLFLKKGRMVTLTDTPAAITQYVSESQSKQTFYQNNTFRENTPIQITSVTIETSLPNNVHEHGKPLSVHVECTTKRIPAYDTWTAIHITDAYGRGVIHTTNGGANFAICNETGNWRYTCTFPALKLYMGRYFISVYLAGPPNGDVYERLVEIINFEVVMHGNNHEFGWVPDVCYYIEDTLWQKSNTTHHV